MKLYKRFKRYFKNRFFRVLAFFTVLIICIVPFSASALDINYEYPPFTFVEIYVFQLFDDGTPPKEIHPSISYNTDGSLQFRFDNKDSYVLSNETDILIEFKLTSDLPDGFLYDLTMDLDLKPSINDIWVSGGGGYKSLFAYYYNSSEYFHGDYHISSSGDHAELSLKGIDASRINEATFSIQNIIYVRESPLFLTFSNIELKGGYTRPDGSSVESYISLEQDFLESLDTDFSPTVDLVSTEAKNSIIKYASSFMGVQYLFDKYALNLGVIGSLLYISLTLGILSVLLNVGSSVAGRISGNISRSNTRSNRRSNRGG